MVITGATEATEPGQQSADMMSSSIPGFDALGPQIFYHRPTEQSSHVVRDPELPPELVIICSWLYARPKHIAKYTNVYQKLYPSSPILLLKQDGPDLMWRPNSWQMQNLSPAVEIVNALQAGLKREPKVLLHVFSNGGAFTACQLADAYSLHHTSQSGKMLLPISALIIDSAPSIPTMSAGFTAMSQGLPSSLPAPVRALGGLMMYTGLVSLSAVSKVLGSEGAISGMRRKLNDRTGAFMQDSLKRTYLYSDTDELVAWRDVELHASQASAICHDRGNGRNTEIVYLEKFEGSKHVAHAVVDPKRYWAIVENAWWSAHIEQ